MSVLNILFVGSDDVARSIAKKSDSRDVDNYVYKDLKEGGLFSTISILRPNNYPDKPKPFFTSLTVSDFGIIEVNKVDGSFGEVIVSMASAGIKDGLVIINPSEGEWVDDSQVKTLLQQAGLSNWEFIENDGVIIREKLIERINSRVEKMFKNGAIKELQRFNKLIIKKENSANKVIGIQEISKYLNGEIGLLEAKKQILIKTRQYAKRQTTWARGQMMNWQKIEPKNLTSALKIFK